MQHSDERVELIGLIYEAALDPTVWPRVADRLADLCGATSAHFLGQNFKTFQVTNIAPRATPEIMRSYADHWVYHNPMSVSVRRVPTGVAYSYDRLMPRRELVRTAFFNEFCLPGGMAQALGTILHADESSITGAALYRPAGKEPFDPSDEKLLASLSPHLQRAVQLNIRLADLEMRRTALAEILDRLSQAALLVDAASRVLFANRAAEEILADRLGLHRRADGTLHHGRQAETSRLHKLIASAAKPVTNGDEGAGGSIRLSRSDERAPLSVLVIPLRAETEWLTPHRPAAILFVTDPERPNVPSAANLRHRFG
jgi:hypothetical protein